MTSSEGAGKGRIIVAHDYLTQRGGAERVALQLCRALGAFECVTAAYAPELTFEGFKDMKVRVSFIGHLPWLRTDPRRALPLLPLAWALIRPRDVDVVVCSSSGWSHGVRVRPRSKKVVYCHNPPRWLYQPEDYLQDRGVLVRFVLRAVRPALIAWDRKAARSADLYVANSTSVATRIREIYGIDAEVLHPPISLDLHVDLVPVSSLKPGYFFTVGRERGYKGTARLVEAFRDLPEERLAIVGPSSSSPLPRNVTTLGRVSDGQLCWLYANARALISVSHEDFGLTPLEANLFGTPCLVLRAGGFLDSTEEGVSGRFVDGDSRQQIVEAVRSFPTDWDRDGILAHAAEFSSERFEQRLWRLLSRTIGVRPVS